jgi:hypothetical protein
MNLRRFGISLAVLAVLAQFATIAWAHVTGGTTAASIPYTANLVMLVVGIALAVAAPGGSG